MIYAYISDIYMEPVGYRGRRFDHEPVHRFMLRTMMRHACVYYYSNSLLDGDYENRFTWYIKTRRPPIPPNWHLFVGEKTAPLHDKLRRHVVRCTGNLYFVLVDR